MTASAKATITALSNNVVINESFRKQLEKMTNMLLQDELTMFLGYESFHRPQSKKITAMVVTRGNCGPILAG
ncbi:MAG: hypothetical protein LKE89_02385 [Lactobacillaceae bacterium]|nr:hypothetical protein [Lactobacillaceae bacterium]